MMDAIAAFLPIVLVVVLMGGLRWGSGRVLPLTWLVAAALAVAAWRVNIVAVSATVGLLGRESELLRRTAIPAVLHGLTIAGFTATALAVGS